MTYSFLLIDLSLFLIPVLLFLFSNAFVGVRLKSIVLPTLLASAIFSAIATLFAFFKLWTFQPAYLMGFNYKSLPIEYHLFIFGFSLTGLSLYTFLNHKFPNTNLQRFSLSVSNLLLGLCIAFLFFGYTKWYTVIAFAVLFVLLLYVEYINELRFMYRFYRAYLVMLVPFYIAYWFLFNLPIVAQKTSETVNLNLANIPIENHFYMMAMLLTGVYLYELFRSKSLK